MGRPKKQKVEELKKTKRTYVQAATVIDRGIPCRHCGALYNHKITNTYPNGNRRRVCGSCGKPFVTVRLCESNKLP